jgi:molybdopterin-guanine dinucleotide biosynthesis protein A
LTREVSILLQDGYQGHDACVLRTPDGIQPLCAVYSRRCLPFFKASIKAGDYRVQTVFGSIDCRFADFENGSVVFNVNTPDDYSAARQKTE